MTLHETEPQFFRRRQSSRERWPELSQAEPSELIEIDRLRLDEGRELSSFGRALRLRYQQALEERGVSRRVPRLFDVPPGNDLLESEASRRARAEVTGVSQPSGPAGGIQSLLAPQIQATGTNLRNLDRLRGAAAGFAIGSAESGTEGAVRGAVSGFREPETALFRDDGLRPQKFLVPPPSIDDFISTVKASDDKITRALIGHTGIDPSILQDSEVGQIAIAHLRVQGANEAIIDTALAAAVDSFAQRGTGRSALGRFGHVFKTDGDGLITNVKAVEGNPSTAWGDVFSNPDRFDFTLQQQEFVDSIRQLIDEVEAVRVSRGLPARARDATEDGWFYVPRSVEQVGDFLKRGLTDPSQERKFEEMLDGINAGVRYSTDVRVTMQSHLRQAFREIADADLNKALESHIATDVDPGLRRGTVRGRSDEPIKVERWREEWLAADDGKALTDLIGEFGEVKLGVVPQAFKNVGDSVRYHAAVGDFAVQFIQGLTQLTRHPAVWAESTYHSMTAFIDPTVQARMIRDNIGTYQEMARAGVPIGDVEFFTALRSGTDLLSATERFVRKITRQKPGVSRLNRAFQQQTFGRFEASYNAYFTAARGLMWSGMRDSWLRRGSTLNALARHVRNMTSGLDSRALGVSPSRRAFESTWVAFSPRYTRSMGALVGEVFSPDPVLRGAAIRALSSLMAGTTAIYVASGWALGKDEKEIIEGLNPLNGKRFLSHEINGDWIGVGGVMRSMLAVTTQVLVNDVGAAAATFAANPGDVGATLGKFGDEGSVLSLDFGDNAIANFYQSRGAPAVSIAGGIVEAASGGRINALRYDEVESPVDLAKHMGTSVLPFALQGFLEGEQPVTTAAALFGARTSAQTPRERRDEILEAGLAALGGDDLDVFIEIEGRNSAVALIRAGLKGTQPALLAELDRIEDERVDGLRRRALRGDQTAKGLLASVDARDRIIEFIVQNSEDFRGIRRTVSEELEAARAIREEPGIQKALDDLPESSAESGQDIDRYFELFDIEERDERDVAEAQFQTEIGIERFQRILRNVFAVTTDMPQQFMDLQKTKLELTQIGYFERDNIAWQSLKDQALPELKPFVEPFDSFFSWRRAATEQARSMIGDVEGLSQASAGDFIRSLNPFTKAIIDGMTEGRKQLDQAFMAAHTELAVEAIKWGYVSTSRLERQGIRELVAP